MKLKLNSMYKIEKGFVIPRSHFSETNPPNYLIADILIGDKTFIKKTVTLTRRELKKLLDLPNNERVEII